MAEKEENKPTQAGDSADAPSSDEVIEAEAPKADRAPEPEPEPSAASGSRLAWVLVFVLLFFIVGVAATPYVLPQALPYLPQQAKDYFQPVMAQQGAGDTSALERRIDQLTADLKDVSVLAKAQKNTDGPAPEVDLSGVNARLDEFDSNLEKLTSEQATQNEDLAGLREILEAVPAEADGGVSPASVAALRADLDALTAQLDLVREDMATAPAAEPAPDIEGEEVAEDAPPAEDALEPVLSRLEAAEARLEALSEGVEGAADPTQLSALDETLTSNLDDFRARLDALEDVRQQTTAAMVAGLESARMAQAMAGGRAFAAELKALERLRVQAGPAMPDIGDVLEQLKPYAETGITTGAALSAQLEARSREVLTIIDTPVDASWWERFVARLRNLVTIRRTGAEASGTRPSDILARAETAARDGNWPQVTEEIKLMPQRARTTLGTWWEEAQARAAAQTALDDLSARLGLSTSEGLGAAAEQAP